VLVVAPCYARGLASDAITFGDETYWTAHAYTAAHLAFVRRDLANPFWTHGLGVRMLEETGLPLFLMPPSRVPKLGLLLIGSSMLLLDAPVPRPKNYDFYQTNEWNREQGRLPPLATLAAARLPSAILGTVAAVCFFQVLRSLVPSAAAFAGALLLALNPLVHWYARLATLDAIATSFTVAAILFTIRACERPERWAPLLLAALLACAAASSKLSAGMLAPVMGTAFLLEAWLRPAPRLLLRGALAGLLAALLFVALNPSLYAAPLAGLGSMLRVGSELSSVRLRDPNVVLADVPSRVAAAREWLFDGFGMLRPWLGLRLDGACFALGLGLLGWRARREAAARVVLLWLVATLAAVSLWTPLRFERYYLPALAPIAAAESVALAWLAQLAARGLRALVPALRAGARA
jgi:4-amino-4-deoxy-L-arabinose transferase-like glycosyltransferase